LPQQDGGVRYEGDSGGGRWERERERETMDEMKRDTKSFILIF